MNTEITRRQMMKGIALGAGAAVMQPILGQLAAHAAGDSRAANRKRFIFVVQSNGMSPTHLVPMGVDRKAPNGRSTTTRFTDISLKDKNLHEALEPLASFKDRLCLVQGLSGRISYSDHSCQFGALGCCPKDRPFGASIDVMLAQTSPAPFKHVGLGYNEGGDEVRCYSASAPGKPVPICTNPREAFKSLFGSATEDGVKSFDTRTKLLQFLAEDVKRSRRALAGSERDKLDSYVAAFETLHARQSDLGVLRDSIKKHAPKLKGDLEAKSTASLILEAQFDIAAAALIAGMTNVVTLTSGGGGQRFGKFPELGIPDLHGIGHGAKYEYKSNDQCFVAIRRVHTRLIANLAKQLAAVPEGDGTMLDNTVIVYTSDSADSHHPSCYEWPVVLLGNLGGKLKTNGRYVDHPHYQARGHRTLSSLYCTLLHAAGSPQDKFGLDDVKLPREAQRGPIPELLA